MKTLQRILGLAVIGTLLVGSRLEAQQQPAPLAPEPEAPAPAQVVPEPDEPVPPPVQPPQADDPGALQTPPQQPGSLQENPFAQPPGQPTTQPPVDSLTQPPYSPQPAGPGRIEFTPPEDPFLPPPGMVTAPECLIELLGFFGHHPFVYSDSNCFDLASAAYRCGYFEDAIALLSHAISQYPQAHYYYLRGMAQMKAGLAHDAIVSADGVLDAEAAGNYGGLDRVRERFNGPLAVQFRQLLQLRQAAR